MTASLRVLANLNTVEDFVELAKKDMDLALRLMEYRDFIEAPFMQDMHVRTVYEGLKGHGNRQNALEEFFLALGVKEPIRLILSTAKKNYDNPTDVISDKVVLKKNTWGYIYIEVRADGDFIELPKKVITQADFEEDRFDLRFKIHPERMHRGKNLGAIKLMTVHGDTLIRIEAMGDTTVDITGREHEISKSGISRYLKLREDYESKTYEEAQTLNKLQKELDAIRGANGNSLVLSLLQAETYLDSGRVDQAALCLDDCRDEIVYEREKLGTLYCFYQYLQYRTIPSPDKKESVLRLFRKKLDDKKGRFYLQMLMLKLDPPADDEAPALYESFKQQYKNGCHSPFLYIETCKLLEKRPELLSSMDAFEIHALYYGAKNGMIGETLAAMIASLASGTKFFHRLHYRILTTLYERFPSTFEGAQYYVEFDKYFAKNAGEATEAAVIGVAEKILSLENADFGVALGAISESVAGITKILRVLIYPVLILGGAANMFITVNTLPLVLDIGGVAKVGTFTGYYYTATFSAQIAAPIVYGFIRMFAGTYMSLFYYSPIMFALAICFLVFVKHGESKITDDMIKEARMAED